MLNQNEKIEFVGLCMDWIKKEISKVEKKVSKCQNPDELEEYQKTVDYLGMKLNFEKRLLERLKNGL